MKKDLILVTGACGFTGYHIVKILREKKLNFIATDLHKNCNECSIECREHMPKDVKYISANLLDKQSLRKTMKGVNIILHPAAIFNFHAPKKLLFKVNVEGTRNLLEVAEEFGVERIVSWSTCGVYGKTNPKLRPIYEDHPQKPIENYSLSKMYQDKVVWEFHNAGKIKATILRPGLVYGPRSNYGTAKIITYMRYAPIMPIPVNMKFHIGPVHVMDIANAAVFFAFNKNSIGKTFHVIDDSGITLDNFLKNAAQAWGIPTIPILVPVNLSATAGRILAEIDTFISLNILGKYPLLEAAPLRYFPLDLEVSNSALKKLGYKYIYPNSKEGLKNTVQWLKGCNSENIEDEEVQKKCA